MGKKLTATTTADGCFFCTMKEPDLSVRRARIIDYFTNTHQVDDQELVLVLSGLWSIAMSEPGNEEFPSLGIFEFMANLIEKCVDNRDFILRNQNIYIPYYAAHIIGSYTINSVKLAVKAVDAGSIPTLLDLMRGKISWVEQRVAVRALGHLASYDRTFEALAVHEDEVVRLAMHLASTCVDVVYNAFVGVADKSKRLKYHCDLLTRGVGDMDMENRKAEEWASQLQCWCLHLLNCFAIKQRSLDLICKPEFLKELCGMWGGLTNHRSPAGIGLLRILCYSKVGRRRMAETKQVLENLCNLSRSSDDWQYMGIDCLLLLLNDPDTRYKVIDSTTLCLVDLIELRHICGRSNFGEKIIKTLTSDFRLRNYKFENKEVHQALDKIWDFSVKKRAMEATMLNEKSEEKRALMSLIKQQARNRFWLGKIEEALHKYTEAIEFCPLRFRKERMLLYSNRAQCHLLLRNPDAAISDTTRALCLSSPPNSHCKSLWRRSQAYDMKGLAKESLMDCIMLIKRYFKSEGLRQVKVPYYAIQMICKQMDSTWLFKGAQLKTLTNSADKPKHPTREDDLSIMDQNLNRSLRICIKNKGFKSGLPTLKEPLVQNGGSTRRRLETTVRRRRVRNAACTL